MFRQIKFVSLLSAIALTAAASAADPPAATPATQPFILGADISWVQQREEQGTHYSDGGYAKDTLQILKDHQFNWIRLRLFYDPKATGGYSRAGYCDLPHTIAMAKRIKAAGMHFLLDFHYSDNWADPGKQVKPSAWKDLHGEQLRVALHDYTRDTLLEFRKQNVLPEMVQVGNEISAGMLRPDGAINQSFDTFNELLKSAISGVRNTDPSIKIMLHLAKGGQNADSRWFLDHVLVGGVEFDLIGQSYYPRWHGTLEDLKANLTDLATRYKQPIIVVEYSAPNIKEINDIVHGLPNGKGLGTFIWEPTSGALFDRTGKTKEQINVYDELAREYQAR